MTDDTARYLTYHVAWSAEDRQFVGTCPLYPSLSWLDFSRTSALDGIVSLVRQSLENTTRERPQPDPVQERIEQYHGRLSADREAAYQAWARSKGWTKPGEKPSSDLQPLALGEFERALSERFQTQPPDPLATLNASLGVGVGGEPVWPEWMKPAGRVWMLDETNEKRWLKLPQLLADLAMQGIACLPASVMRRLISANAAAVNGTDWHKLADERSAEISRLGSLLDDAVELLVAWLPAKDDPLLGEKTALFLALPEVEQIVVAHNRANWKGPKVLCPACGADYAEAEASNAVFQSPPR